MTVEPIEPHGFCRGVAQALRLAESALASAPAFCLHPLVHNGSVADALAAKGMRTVASLADVPAGETLVVSAHGIHPSLRAEALRMGLKIVDATCPFVARMHRQACGFAQRGVPVAVVGHAGHVEVQGVVGAVEASGGTVRVVCSAGEVAALPFSTSSPVGVLCQTTFDAESAAAVLSALSARYPSLEKSPASDICTATRDRQESVRRFVRSGGDGVLVLGSAASSNTCRLLEVARSAGARFAVRAETSAEVAALDLAGVRRLGVTAGASTPESVVSSVLAALRSR